MIVIQQMEGKNVRLKHKKVIIFHETCIKTEATMNRQLYNYMINQSSRMNRIRNWRINILNPYYAIIKHYLPLIFEVMQRPTYFNVTSFPHAEAQLNRPGFSYSTLSEPHTGLYSGVARHLVTHWSY